MVNTARLRSSAKNWIYAATIGLWSPVVQRCFEPHLRGPLLVAEQAGHVVGFITFGPDVGPPVIRESHGRIEDRCTPSMWTQPSGDREDFRLIGGPVLPRLPSWL